MRSVTVLLATAFVLVSSPMVLADEGAPDCESDQPWIGYARSQPVHDAWNEIEGAAGTNSGLNVCEGEHWDGQDTASSGHSGDCAGDVSADPSDVFVGRCESADPNAGPSDDPTNPLGIRVGVSGQSAVYTSTNIVLVGRAGAYADDGTVAVYVRDNTPGNLLAQVVSAPRITQGFPDEDDCDQTTYQQGAFNPPSQCGRDNTAITVEHALLA